MKASPDLAESVVCRSGIPLVRFWGWDLDNLVQAKISELLQSKGVTRVRFAVFLLSIFQKT
jgi:hypothetical protein